MASTTSATGSGWSPTTSRLVDALSDFASILGVELWHIDADTTTRQLRNEIRRNGAYQRLAQGTLTELAR
jgi:L-arabinose isomerase